MADLSRFLPLSRRPEEDESGVDRDVAGELRVVLSALLVARAEDGPDAPALVALADRLTPGTTGDARTRLLAVTEGAGRRSVAELGEVVLVASDAGLPLEAEVTAMVVVHRTTKAPQEIRRAVRGRTLIAADAGWRVGHGPEIVASAADLVGLVYGRPLP
jgi:hypothetical protein